MLSLFKSRFTPAMGEKITEVLSSGQIASGKYVQLFEREFSKLINVEYSVSINDMTNAIYLALKLSGVKEGDEVLAVSFSCMSSNSPISLCGAIPVWVDLEEDSVKVDIEKFESLITSKTKAAIVYHIAGYPNAIEQIAHICKRYNIKLIEDCNNALLATSNGRHLGSFGDFSIFSFYPNRLINATEGGMLVCKNKDDYEKVLTLKRFGVDPRFFRDKDGEIDENYDIPVTNFSMAMNNLCCAIAYTQLSDVSDLFDKCRDNAKFYDEHFRNIEGIQPIKLSEGDKSSYWVYLVKVDNKKLVLKYMKEHGVSVSGLHQNNHIYSCFKKNSQSTFVNVDKLQERVIALPCGWWLSVDDCNVIVSVLQKAIDFAKRNSNV
ncbi:DegT/DnrJ/EryC1/StrS family aminotransferase [Vibrio vulnificus]|uniref:DegT/DnrJ/EryC1/StrS family aminotransferase n=1 Tax=Vibrio vulnificus TaxID=672 RepID=UPI000503CD0F|nr:DegT/DnrJ/EryC1/StrS family aminotransferase [Vibrio vulnificus]ASJ39828.1 hypothetical protein VVCECT4999_14430 [Vibrio vulnificus]EGR0354187.1 pyridoxal-phosphate-dependent/plp-dependent aminotransferase [Vibrio vulnificus]EGR0641542.1 pyridoxal-phosphate-dependent/plp-dependent aminotransferase [Vibrio vulnificus]EHD2252661.1 pyridoxal-phosphate-dependent/plp-dependent aminotransferase [Vibrio vulnificus]EHH0803991.1 pyridoxal-phosphate-dependent/plp-dependent aminotransferase [Vibrio vu